MSRDSWVKLLVDYEFELCDTELREIIMWSSTNTRQAKSLKGIGKGIKGIFNPKNWSPKKPIGDWCNEKVVA